MNSKKNLFLKLVLIHSVLSLCVIQQVCADVDVHIGFMDEEVTGVLQELIAQQEAIARNPDATTPHRTVIVIERFQRDDFTDIASSSSSTPGSSSGPSSGSARQRALLFQKAVAKYSTNAMPANPMPERTVDLIDLAQNPALPDHPSLVERLAAQLPLSMSHAFNLDIPARLHAENFEQKVNYLTIGDPARRKTGAQPKLNLILARQGATDADPIFLIRSPEMGLQPLLIKPFLLGIQHAIRAVVSEPPLVRPIHVHVYGTGGAIGTTESPTPPGALTHVQGSIFASIERVDDAELGATVYQPIIKIVNLTSQGTLQHWAFHSGMYFTDPSKALTTVKKLWSSLSATAPAQSVFVQTDERVQQLRTSLQDYFIALRLPADAEFSLTVSYFGGEHDKNAAAILSGGRAKDVNMEDYQLMLALEGIQDLDVRRLACDPSEITPEVQRAVARWLLESTMTVRDYVDAIMWGLMGGEVEQLPPSGLWSVFRGSTDASSMVYPAEYPNGSHGNPGNAALEAIGLISHVMPRNSHPQAAATTVLDHSSIELPEARQFGLIDPFWNEIAVDFIASVKERKVFLTVPLVSDPDRNIIGIDRYDLANVNPYDATSNPYGAEGLKRLLVETYSLVWSPVTLNALTANDLRLINAAMHRKLNDFQIDLEHIEHQMNTSDPTRNPTPQQTAGFNAARAAQVRESVRAFVAKLRFLNVPRIAQGPDGQERAPGEYFSPAGQHAFLTLFQPDRIPLLVQVGRHKSREVMNRVVHSCGENDDNLSQAVSDCPLDIWARPKKWMASNNRTQTVNLLLRESIATAAHRALGERVSGSHPLAQPLPQNVWDAIASRTEDHAHVEQLFASTENDDLRHLFAQDGAASGTMSPRSLEAQIQAVMRALGPADVDRMLFKSGLFRAALLGRDEVRRIYGFDPLVDH